MAATYNPALPTDRDWVRLLTGDRDVVSPRLQDEEIDALLAEALSISGRPGLHVRYLAAASGGETVIAKAGGQVSKQVGDLRIQYGSSERTAYENYIAGLRRRGVELLDRANGSAVFRVL